VLLRLQKENLLVGKLHANNLIHCFADSLLVEWLKDTFEANLIRSFFSVTVSEFPFEAGITIGGLPLGFLHLCGFYACLLQTDGSDSGDKRHTSHLFQMALLNNLTYVRIDFIKPLPPDSKDTTPPLISLLWWLIQKTAEVQDLSKAMLVNSPENMDQLGWMLQVFARTFSHLLVTLDDTQFFEEQTYFRIQTLVDMVSAIKVRAFCLNS
jgi:hypothetical protein